MASSLGIITIRSAFLPDEESLRTDEYQSAIVKIAEAIVKQYFGGLISPKQWKYEWLWEGIRQYLSKLILSLLEPQWPMDEMQLFRFTISALNVDAIQQRGNIIDSSIMQDDTFHVDKTVAILSMLHATLGDDYFRACLKSFIGTRRYMTAEPVDLYNACHKQINETKNIRELLDLWTKQPGYPLLTVAVNGTTIEISQKPFDFGEFKAIADDSYFPNWTSTTSTPAPVSRPAKKHFWVFPVKYVTNMGDGVLWLDSEYGIISVHDHFMQNRYTIMFHYFAATIHLESEVKWVKFNADQMGYYRVQYEEENWSRLIEQMKSNHERFSTKDRMGLITDAFALCEANMLQCRHTINLISYLPKEKSWGPMITGLKHLEQWRRTLKYSECYLMLSEFVREILGKSAANLGWQNVGSDTIK